MFDWSKVTVKLFKCNIPCKISLLVWYDNYKYFLNINNNYFWSIINIYHNLNFDLICNKRTITFLMILIWSYQIAFMLKLSIPPQVIIIHWQPKTLYFTFILWLVVVTRLILKSLSNNVFITSIYKNIIWIKNNILKKYNKIILISFKYYTRLTKKSFYE